MNFEFVSRAVARLILGIAAACLMMILAGGNLLAASPP